jgi:hypothetical protein
MPGTSVGLSPLYRPASLKIRGFRMDTNWEKSCQNRQNYKKWKMDCFGLNSFCDSIIEECSPTPVAPCQDATGLTCFGGSYVK